MTNLDSLLKSPSMEKEMATHSNILAWRIPWREERGRLQSTGHKESGMTELLNFHEEVLYFSFTFCHKGGIIYIYEVIDISPGNLDSNCASSSPAFRMMYSAYKLNKQGDNIQP